MKRRDLLAATALLASSSAAAGGGPQTGVEQEIKGVLERQARQWSAGDIEGFCSHYAEDCLFLSPGGLTRGRQGVLDRYRQKYVDRAAMGTLTLAVLGAVHEPRTASVALRWTLGFVEKQEATGLSLIGLQKLSDKGTARWLIIHDASM